MYASFYNLRKEPFHITPDPEFLFLSPSHREALGSIVYGVNQRKGFVMLTGEVGVGKTTIIRSYLEQEDTSKLKIIYLFNANVSFLSLLKTIFQQLEIPILTDDVFEMVNQLHFSLIDEFRKGFIVVLIIDEAQNMPVETLENLRMLSNLETSTTKLIQIVFSGQPEFEHKLERKELRQLKQRIAVKATIKPLTRQESIEYIRHRIAKVSTGNLTIFSASALRKIVVHARGIPRIINILCENSFITALGYRRKTISARIVSEVIADFEGNKRKPLLKYGLAASITAIVATSAFVASHYLEIPLSAAGRNQTLTATTNANPDLNNEISRSAPAIAPAAEVAPVTKTPEPDKAAQAAEAVQRVRTVRKGDTLSALISETYGFSSRRLIAYIQKNNPAIRDANQISVGDRIVFPAREEREEQ